MDHQLYVNTDDCDYIQLPGCCKNLRSAGQTSPAQLRMARPATLFRARATPVTHADLKSSRAGTPRRVPSAPRSHTPKCRCTRT